MAILLPRLPGPAAENLLEQFLANGPSAWTGFDASDLPDAVRFAATGGSRVNSAQLLALRNRILQVAKANSLGRCGSRAWLAKFDAEVAALLAEEQMFASGEALRDDVWAFLGVSLAPDVVNWRFHAARERYLGGVRNTFQRLWMRGRALDRGAGHSDRWGLLVELTEDALVQITERPSLGGDPVLARAIAEGWLRAEHHYGKRAMEPIMRRAALRIRIWNEIRSLADLPSEQLARVIADAFGLSSESRSEGSPGEGKMTTDAGGMTPEQVSGGDALDAENTEVFEKIPNDVIPSISQASVRVRTEAKQRG